MDWQEMLTFCLLFGFIKIKLARLTEDLVRAPSPVCKSAALAYPVVLWP